MPTPHLAASTALAATSTATTVTITSATTVGNAIIVAIDISPSWSMTVTSVTDTKGNSYTQAAGTSGTFCWVALNTTALTTSDKVTVTWSATGSVAKNVIIMDCPGIATAQAVDGAGTTNTDSSAAVSVTSGTPAQTGELAVLVINNTNSGGAPTALGSFTAITPAIHNGSTQYLTMAYETAGAGAVTGSATITSTLWVALLILLAPAPVSTRPGATVGADINDATYPGTLDQNISEWQNQVINPGRTLDCIRVFFGTNIPSSIGNSGLQRHVGIRRVLMSMKPAVSGDPSDLARIDGFLASCVAAGLDAKVTLNHEPSPDMSASAYIACVRYYGPTIRKYYPYVYCQAAYRTHVDPSIPGAYYPGDGQCDECAYDYYEYDFRLYGVKLDSMANIADRANPPKPFSCWEIGVVVGGVNGTTAGAPGAATRAQGTAYMQYVTNFFAARRTAGKATGDISYYNYINAAKNWDHVIQPGSYLAPLYDQLYDAMSGAGTTATASLASELDITVNLAESLTAGATAPPVPPPATGGQPPSATYPQLIVEAGLLPAAPVSVLGTFILDDPVYGQLDAGRLGATTAWTDITRFVRSGSVSRPSTRVQGPLLTYQAGTCSLVLDNADGRFDPDNISGPYAAGGQTLVQPMIPVRVSAVFGAVSYPLFSGFADSWQDDGVNYGGRYAQVTVSATDGFKILAGQNLPAVANPLGDSELSGARVNRILSQAGWYTDHRKVAAGDSAVQGTTLGDSPLNLLQLTADTEIGELYVDGGGSLVFRNRHAILAESRSTTPQAVFGDAPGTVHTAGTELPYLSATRADDDTTLANDVQITAVGGTMQQSTSPGSVAKYLFPRSYTRSDVLLTSDAEARSYAQWVRYVSQSTVNRVEGLSVLPGRDPGNLFPQALGREIGDRIQVWRRPPGMAPVVTMYGAAPALAPLSSLAVTASGHTLTAVTVAGWGFGAGEGAFYTRALPDGKIAITTVPLTENELKPTSDHAELAVFDPVARAFTRIVVPTSAGALTAVTPGDSVGGTDAGGGDIVIAGSRALFTCEGYYFGWSIPTTGLYPALGFLKSQSGQWSYDAAGSLTGDQWQATNPTAFTVIQPAGQTAGNGASYWSPRSPGQMTVLPQSGRIVVGHYFGTGTYTSGVISVSDASGNLLAAYQIPNITPLSGTITTAAVRDVEADPSSPLNDERFVIIYDAFGSGVHATFQEFSYNDSTHVIVPKSVPCTVTDTAAVPSFVLFGPDGTLYLSCSNGLTSANMSVYLKTGGERAPVAQFPVGQAISDALLASNGFLTGDASGFEGGTANWVSAGNCAIAQTAAQAHSGTKALALTSSAAGNMQAASTAAASIGSSMSVAPGDTVSARAWFRSAVSARSCNVGVEFYDSTGTLIGSALRGSNITDSTTAWTQATALVTAPAGAAHCRANIQVLATAAASEVHYADDVLLGSWASTSWPTPVTPDYSLGFPVGQSLGGLAGPLAIDANGTVLVPGLTGRLGAIIPSGTAGLGPNLMPAHASGFEPDNMLTPDDSIFASSLGSWTATFGTTSRVTPGVAPPSGTWALSVVPFSGAINVHTGNYPAAAGLAYRADVWFLAATTGRTCEVWLSWIAGDGTTSLGATSHVTVTDNTTTWTLASVTGTAPASTAFARIQIQVDLAAAGEAHLAAANALYSLDAGAAGWTGFATGVVLTGAAALDGGFSLQMASIANNELLSATGPAVQVRPLTEYLASAWFRSAAGGPAQVCKINVNWQDSSGAAISTTACTMQVTDSTSGWSQATCGAMSPAGAATATITLAPQTTTTGEAHYADRVTLQAQPWTAVPACEYGVAALRAAGYSIIIGRPSVAGRRLYIPVAGVFSSAENAAYSQSTYVPDTAHPMWLAAVDIDQFTTGSSAAGVVVKDCFVRGIQHDFDASAQSWATAWTLQDAGRYGNFLVLDSPSLGVLNSQSLAY